jgi:hypothetical protein
MRNARHLVCAATLYAVSAPQLPTTPRMVQLAAACTLLVHGGPNVAFAFPFVFLYTGRFDCTVMR